MIQKRNDSIVMFDRQIEFLIFESFSSFWFWQFSLKKWRNDSKKQKTCSILVWSSISQASWTFSNSTNSSSYSYSPNSFKPRAFRHSAFKSAYEKKVHFRFYKIALFWTAVNFDCGYFEQRFIWSTIDQNNRGSNNRDQKLLRFRITAVYCHKFEPRLKKHGKSEPWLTRYALNLNRGLFLNAVILNRGFF